MSDDADTETWLASVQRKSADLLLTVRSKSLPPLDRPAERCAGRIERALELFRIEVDQAHRRP